MSRPFEPLPARLARCSRRADTGCLIWTGSHHRNGYGRLRIGDTKDWLAHRVSWLLANGEWDIPPLMEICHRCDVRDCIEPDHLFLGTHTDNVRDAWSKGRAATPPRHSFWLPEWSLRGEQHPLAKLTAEKVLEIRALRASGSRVPYAQIARGIGITRAAVRSAAIGKTWSHLGVF